MKYIEIVGIMGTGKTSLAKLFNEQAQCKQIIENEQDLARMFFVAEYLSNPDKYGFEGGLNFSAFHLNRIQEKITKLPQDAIVIVDTAPLTQYAWAKGAVSEEEQEVLEKIIQIAYRKLPPVDLRIVTKIPAELHMQRIVQRGREFEMGVSLDFLCRTQSLVDEAVAKFGGDVPTLELDASQLNWAANENDKRTVLRLAQEKLRGQLKLNGF
jgi:deoxyadenosine/deoxycytidine kinase